MAAKHPGLITGTAWLLQITTAVLLSKSLFLKFTYAPQAQVIFEPIGGRPAATLMAVAVLIAVAFLLLPTTFLSRIDPACPCSARHIRGWGDVAGWIGYANVLGAVLALGVIGSVIVMHLFVLGIQIPVAPGSRLTDGGSIFALEVVIAAAAAVVFLIRRREANTYLHAVVNVAKKTNLPAAAAATV